MQSRIIDGKYEVLRELSQGGMGAVFEARHLLTGRRVALKLILAETLARGQGSDALRRFEREARAGGSIDSRHVVSVLDTGRDAATQDQYIVMELLSGEDLRELLRRLGVLPPQLVLRIAAQVCLGLHSAHERNIVHRDIKTANIYLARRDGGEVEVKVLDFGIAKLRIDPLTALEGHDLTRSGSVLGSPLYMSPEQATGSRGIDRRSDVWSLGVVMYEALSGTTPHGNQTLGSLILAICSQPVPPLRERAPWVSSQLAAIVHKALALEPGQRFPTVEAMRREIMPLIVGQPTIHESMLGAAPAREGLILEAPTMKFESASAGFAVGGQTTADAVTFGSGVPPRPEPTPPARRAWLWRAGIGAGLAIATGVAFSRSRSEPPLTGVPNDAPSVPAAAAAKTAPREVPALPSAGNVPAASVAPAPAPAPPAVRMPRPADLARRSSRAPVRTPASSAPASAAPPGSSVVAPPTPTTPVISEPAIDRRFD